VADSEKKDQPVEPANSAIARGAYRVLAKALRSFRKAVAGADHPEFSKFAGETCDGMAKACGVMRKMQGKMSKDHPLDDDDTLAKAFDDEDARYEKWLSTSQVEHEDDGTKGDPAATHVGKSEAAGKLEIDSDADDAVAKSLLAMIQAQNERLDLLLK